jgi:Uma2 family endonuclease
MAPDIAVEVRSPGDSRRDLVDKIDVLLRAGTNAVVVVNPRTRTVVVWHPAGKRVFFGEETFEHPTIAGLTFALPEMFGALTIHRPR